MDNAIELIGVHKSFQKGTEVFKGLNLEIPRGKITVIIGYSGAGKSVLLKHILGLIRPDKGTVNVLGQDLSQLNEQGLNEVRKRFGMLFQSAALFDDMSAIENVKFPIHEFRSELPLQEVNEIAAKNLKVVGLGPEHFSKYPAELSGGMRKRVGLARALALEPDILLYDEPTTGLDPIMTEVVDNLIVGTHGHRKGVTSVVISHDLASAFGYADQIAMLHQGGIKLQGPPQVFLETIDPFIKKFVGKAKGLSQQ